MSFRLTRKAETDILDIYRYGAATFGIAQADAYHERLDATFRLLADQPLLARERTELDPQVRIHPCGAHIVVYVVTENHGVLIVRVRHASEDWMADRRHPAD